MGLPLSAIWDYVDDSGTSVSLVNEDSDYPAENAQSEEVADCCRSTDKTSIKYRMTLASGVVMRFFAILNHNFSGGTVKIHSYTAGDWSTGKQVEAELEVKDHDMYLYLRAATNSRQYWEFDLAGVTSADSYYEVGRFMMYANGYAFVEKEDYRIERGYGFRNIINETKYGIRWAHKVYEKRNRFKLRWPVVKEDRYIPISDMEYRLKYLYENQNGDAHPFLFLPDYEPAGNLCTNGGFENNLDGWSAVNNASLFRGMGIGKGGTNCLQIIDGDTNSPAASYTITDIEQYEWYYFECYAEKQTEDEFRPYLYDVTGSANIWIAEWFTETLADWTTRSCAIVQAPAGCASIRIYLMSRQIAMETKTFRYDSVYFGKINNDCFYVYLEAPEMKWIDVDHGDFVEDIEVGMVEAVRGAA